MLPFHSSKSDYNMGGVINVNDFVVVDGGTYVCQCGKVIGIRDCMYRIVLDGYDNVVIRVIKHNVSKIAPSMKAFMPSVRVSTADDVCYHLDLMLYNIL